MVQKLSFFLGILIAAQNYILAETGNVVCYFQSEAYVLSPPEDMDPSLCTHLNYAFLTVSEQGTLLVQNEKIDMKNDMYRRVAKLKLKNPNLKLLFSVNPWTTLQNFSSTAASKENRQRFINSSREFIEKYNYDGIDIDWEFPTANDSANFIQLLKEIREEFDKEGWLLTSAVSANPRPGFNAPEMSKYLHFWNIMSYDYFGPWSATTGQNSPLYPSSLYSNVEKKFLSLYVSGKNWIAAGAPKEKVNIGVAFYGRSFTLVDPDNHGLHAPVTGAGNINSPTYRQVCSKYDNWTTVWDDEQKNPYKYLGDQWLGYDDMRSLRKKAQHIMDEEYAGVMIWHIGGDDIYGQCGEKQALLKMLNHEIRFPDKQNHTTDKPYQ